MRPEENTNSNKPSERLPAPDFNFQAENTAIPTPESNSPSNNIDPNDWNTINSEYPNNQPAASESQPAVHSPGDPLPGEIEPKKVIPWKKIILIPAIVIAVVLLLVAGINAWNAYSQDQAAKKAEAARQAAEEERLRNMASFPLNIDISASNVIWDVPDSIKDWELSGSGASQKLTNKTLESIFDISNMPTGSSLTSTNDQDRSVEYVKQQAALVKAELNLENNLKFTDSSKKTVEFATGSFSSKNSEGKSIKTRVTVRATAATLYIVRYDAPEAKFSDDIWNNITNKLVLKGNFS